MKTKTLKKVSLKCPPKKNEMYPNKKETSWKKRYHCSLISNFLVQRLTWNVEISGEICCGREKLAGREIERERERVKLCA